MKQKSFSETIVSLSRTVIISSITIFALYSVSAWTGPSSTAPAGNVSGPITTSGVDQAKSGGLGVGNFVATGLLRFTNGAGAGKVLTSDAIGIASWQNPSSGVKSSVPIYQCPLVVSPYLGNAACYIMSNCISGCVGQPSFTEKTCRYVSDVDYSAVLSGLDGAVWTTKDCPLVGNVMVSQ